MAEFLTAVKIGDNIKLTGARGGEIGTYTCRYDI